MALAIADRVKETTTSTGTGTINLAGASTGFQTFVAGIGGGNTCYYAIEDADGSAWEVGIGTVTDASPDTLARTTVLKSTNSNNALTLTSGTHTVFATYPSDKAVFKDESGIVLASGIQVGASGLLLDSVTITTLQIHSESFVDNDTSLMTSKAIADKIEDYGYSTTAGDITAVVAGSGISGGANDGSATVTLDLNGWASGVIANDDYLVFVDADGTGKKDNLPDIATLFAGTNLTATNSVIAVADAFLVNDDNDTTTGTITSAGFTTTGNVNAKDGNFKEFDSWVYSSGIRIGASGIILDGTAVTASVTELNYVDGVTSAVQTQLDAKQASLTFGISNTNAVKVDSASAADDEYARFTANGLESRSTSEVLSDIGAQASIGGAASTVTSSDLTASRALVSNGSGKIAVSSTTSTELGYIDVSTLGTAEASKALTLDSDKKFTGVKDGTFNQADSWITASGVHVGPSGTVMLDADLSHSITLKAPDVVSTSFTLLLPSGMGSAGQVLTTDSVQSYWSSAGATIANDAANRITTADGDGTFTAEANITYDGSTFLVNDDMTVGAAGGSAGHDIIFYGDTDGRYLHWRESQDELGLIGASRLSFHNVGGGEHIYASADGHLEINAGTTLDITAPNVDINVNGKAVGGGKLNVDGLIESSGVTVGTSGVVMKDADLSHSITVKAPEVVSTSFTFLLPSGDGSNGQVLTTDSKNTYWSTTSGGVSGDTFATDLKIGRDSDNLIDFATTDNKIILRANGNDEVELVENALSPVANDGVALGTGSLMWSDLFLASAGVINFNNGDVTLTHSSNNLTIAGGTLTTEGIIREVATKVDTNYTIAADDHIILVDTTNSDRTITLPSAAAANIGQEYTVKKIDSGTGVVNIVPASTGGYGPDDIDEYDTKYVLYVQHDSVTFVCGLGDATAGDEQWWVIAERKQAHAGIMQRRTPDASDYGQNISSGTFTKVLWDTLETARPANLADITSNERFTIRRAGIYKVCAHFWYDNAVDVGQRCDIAIYKNGSLIKQTKSMVAHSNNMYVDLHLNTVMNLAVDDYLECYTYHNHGSAIRIHVSTGGERYPTFAISEIL